MVELKFGPTRERSIVGAGAGFPSLVCGSMQRRTTCSRVLGGLGVAIISMSGGLMTDKQAGKRGVGGKVLAYVW